MFNFTPGSPVTNSRVEVGISHPQASHGPQGPGWWEEIHRPGQHFVAPWAGVFHYDEHLYSGETEKEQERNGSHAVEEQNKRNEGSEQQAEVGGLLVT